MPRKGGGVYNDRTGRGKVQPQGMPSAASVKNAPAAKAPAGQPKRGTQPPTNPTAAAAAGLRAAKGNISDSRQRG